MRIRLAKAARTELVDAIRDHEQEREGIGEELAEEIDRAVRLIAERPLIGADIGKGERKFTVDRFRYKRDLPDRREDAVCACDRPPPPQPELLAQAKTRVDRLEYDDVESSRRRRA